MQFINMVNPKINVNHSNFINSVQWKKDKWYTHNQNTLCSYTIKLIECIMGNLY